MGPHEKEEIPRTIFRIRVTRGRSKAYYNFSTKNNFVTLNLPPPLRKRVHKRDDRWPVGLVWHTLTLTGVTRGCPQLSTAINANLL